VTRKLVVTGAAGMVGQNLVPALLARGDAVLAVDKHAGNLEILKERAPGALVETADLADPGAWQERFAGVSAVVDLKAQITAPVAGPHQRNNVEATLRVLDACRRHRVPHLVFLSSSVVISVADDHYTRTKREAERAVRESDVPHTVLRPPLMYGPGDVKHLGYILGLMERLPLLPIPGHGRYMRQPLYVGDLVQVILAATVRGPSGEAHNVIGHERLTFIDLLRRVGRLRKARCRLQPLPLPLFRAALALQGWLFRRPAFTREQLQALMAGDDFPVDDWAGRFGVRYTPFDEAAPGVYADPADRLRRQMTPAH
jgi:nucleoside-diphosphate-sugar epimerase